MSAAMNPPPMLDYAALAAAPVNDTPYRHIMVRDFLPADTLAKLHRELPRSKLGGSFPPEALKLGPIARTLMAEMEGPTLRAEIARKLDIDLGDAPSMLTMRLYCRERDGQIHTDSAAKRVTILLYLNEEKDAFAHREGCLRLLRSPTDLEDYAVEVPPTRGTLLVFPNGPTTWHGHRTYVGPRFSLQLNYMTNDSKARSELFRHKVSAIVKRLAA
jgi:SM-20-related protein